MELIQTNSSRVLTKANDATQVTAQTRFPMKFLRAWFEDYWRCGRIREKEQRSPNKRPEISQENGPKRSPNLVHHVKTGLKFHAKQCQKSVQHYSPATLLIQQVDRVDVVLSAIKTLKKGRFGWIKPRGGIALN